jgi:hypothetical protein
MNEEISEEEQYEQYIAMQEMNDWMDALEED